MQISENRNDKRYVILATMLLRIQTFLDVTFCSRVNSPSCSEETLWDCWTLENVETMTLQIVGKCSSSNTAPHRKRPKSLSARVTVKGLIESTMPEYHPSIRHLSIHYVILTSSCTINDTWLITTKRGLRHILWRDMRF